MNTTVIKEPDTLPSISILLPLNKDFTQHKGDKSSLKNLVRNAETELHKNYPKEIAKKLIEKLDAFITKLNLSSKGESVAIYVSDDIEKIIYLPVKVKEQVVIDKSFEVRDLLYASKSTAECFVVAISQNEVRTFACYGNFLFEYDIENMPQSTEDVKRDHPQKTGNFTDAHDIKENDLHKYLHEIDKALTTKLNELKTKVIICTPERIAGHFKNITHNTKSIAGYVDGNFDHLSAKKIYETISPLLDEIKAAEQNNVMQKLQQAAQQNKVISGVERVFNGVETEKGKILVVEKDFHCPAIISPGGKHIVIPLLDHPEINYPKDIVDDIIETILRKQGEVYFVDNNSMSVYNHIALITYY
jgi:hypothetical protein